MTFLNWVWRREVELFLAAVLLIILLTCGGC